MGGAYGMYGEVEGCIQDFGGISEGRDNLEDLSVDRSIILKLIFNN
jgi:hypothetical protein